MFVSKPTPQKVKAGEIALFKAQVDGYPIPNVSWLLNSRQLKEEDAHIQFNATTGEATLSIPNVVLEKHAGSITCYLKNSHGNQQETVGFDVLVAPVITMQFLEQQEIVMEQDVKLTLIARGSPRPTAEWFFRDKPIETKNVLVTEINGEYQLLIKQATVAQNEGSYQVVLENEVGKVRSTACALVVLERVKLTKIKPVSNAVILEVGEAFNIIVDVSGKETPKCQLTKDEKAVQFTSEETTRYTFSVVRVTREHQGVYKVTAKNKASPDGVTMTISLNVIGKFVCISEHFVFKLWFIIERNDKRSFFID